MLRRYSQPGTCALVGQGMGVADIGRERLIDAVDREQEPDKGPLEFAIQNRRMECIGFG